MGSKDGNEVVVDTADVAVADAESTEPVEEEKTYAGMTRRTLCLGVGGAAVLLGMGGLKLVGSTPVVRPPGGQDEDRLLSACIRCEKCLEICPHDIIVPSHIENGILGVRTPTLDFSAKWCDWCAEANGGEPLCVKVCPTEALSLPEAATPENTILGIAVLKKEYCLAHKVISCRFCYDACEFDAIKLDKDNIPYVINDACNGCGACESVCVSLQNSSIDDAMTTRAIVIEPVEA